MELNKEIPPAVIEWSRLLKTNSQEIERLNGGINNKVFRCGKKGKKWIIKHYMPSDPKKQDRMEAEFQFLQYANIVAPKFTPKLIKSDKNNRCLIIEDLKGRKFIDGKPPQPKAVKAAVEFLRLLNEDKKIARETIKLDAAEGYLTLQEHIENIKVRLGAMTCIHLNGEIKKDAKIMLEEIREELEVVEGKTRFLIQKGSVMDAIDPNERCISPSDFGFHNAIETDNGVKFIDFEFGGWDDPSKATTDFVLQPRIPVRNCGSPLLSVWKPENKDAIRERCKYIAPILRLKWACIQLSVLNQDRLRQIMEIDTDQEIDELIAKRLKNTMGYLEWSKVTIRL